MVEGEQIEIGEDEGPAAKDITKEEMKLELDPSDIPGASGELSSQEPCRSDGQPLLGEQADEDEGPAAKDISKKEFWKDVWSITFKKPVPWPNGRLQWFKRCCATSIEGAVCGKEYRLDGSYDKGSSGLCNRCLKRGGYSVVERDVWGHRKTKCQGCKMLVRLRVGNPEQLCSGCYAKTRKVAKADKKRRKA